MCCHHHGSQSGQPPPFPTCPGATNSLDIMQSCQARQARMPFVMAHFSDRQHRQNSFRPLPHWLLVLHSDWLDLPPSLSLALKLVYSFDLIFRQVRLTGFRALRKTCNSTFQCPACLLFSHSSPQQDVKVPSQYIFEILSEIRNN